METTIRILFGNSYFGAIMRIILLFVLFTFPFFNKYNITYLIGNSMYSQFDDGEMVVVERNKGYYTPKRYDVISIQRENELWIKRIIGLPGDHVKYGSGRVWLNGTRETTFEYLNLNEIPRSSFISFEGIVPEGMVWVIGDNRYNSAHDFIYIEDIIGKVVY